ncbi:RDD family protein [Allobaculum stercoricanis]|uniref:RDD family protein n=1 Tax=Allobaculum stercoricanis TaxID=174709 RepID=UPI0003617721|nr:RDD family protein [Allobaculum stercoricanis]
MKQGRKTKQAAAKKNESRAGYFVKRLFAFGFDWYLSGILANIAISLCYGFFNQGKIEVQYGFENMTTPQSLITIGILALIFLFYYVYVPAKIWKGQTLMLHVMQLKVVDLNDQEVGLKTLLFRFVVGCLLLEGTFYFFTSAFKTMLLTKFLPLDTGTMDLLLSGPIVVISVISLLMSLRDKTHSQTLHDKISKTYVKDIHEVGNGAL